MLYIRKSDDTDIIIIAEGTYPYKSGGVASWIHQIIVNLKEFKFGIIFLGSRKEDYEEIKYILPKNLVHLEVHFLFDGINQPTVKAIRGNKKLLPHIKKIHDWFKTQNKLIPDEIKNVDSYIKDIDEKQFLYSKMAWNYITEKYSNNCPTIPFIDYFWNIRNIHIPIWKVAEIAYRIKIGKVFHSVSTGYAGLLGAFLSYNTSKPLILTEHGIYTRERKIDMFVTDFVMDHKPSFLKQFYTENYIKQLWTRFFEGIGRFCYNKADYVISLFGNARDIQLTYGASSDKTKVIANGIDVNRYSSLINKRPKNIPKVITLIGRVVSIKDIKTFIRAIRIVVNHINDVEAWIVGPVDEDKEYVMECHNMVDILDLQKNVKILGFKNIEEILPETGIVTLTSISEGMPLIILEGFAAGVPAVATDVGACKELIYGSSDEDKKIGKAGEVVPIADPNALAKAYIEIIGNELLWKTYQKAAVERVNKYYNEKIFFKNYRNIYNEAIGIYKKT